MSIRLMTQVWQRLNCSGGELLLALALADIADDDGDRIYPSLVTLAFKTRQSERHVRRQLGKFRKLKWLQTKSLSKGGIAKGGHGITTRYRINPLWIKGDILSGFPDAEGGHLRQETRTFETGNPDIAMSGNPSLSILDPKNKKRARVSPSDSRASKEKLTETKAEEGRRKRIRDYIRDLRLTPYGRDPKVIAINANCSVEEAERELETLQ